MMFPKDRTVYANLNTSFTDFDELLLDLRVKATTGYVLVSFRSYDGVLFLENGDIVSALEQDAEAKRTSDAAATNIALRAHEKGGCINVYTLAPELLRLLTRVVDAEALYRDLTSSFTSLEKLIEKLQEDKHSGYLEVTLNEGRGGAMVFFESGRLVECVFATGGQTATGAEGLPTVLAATASAGGSFNVFRANEPNAAKFATAADTPKPAPAPQLEPPSAAPAAAERPPLDVLTIWSEIIAGAESVVDGLSREGRFSTTFKEVLVTRAGTYPFLDPFAAEFAYANGKVTFDGTLPPDFSKGVGDCLLDAVSRLAFQLKRADLETRIRNQLADFGAEHKAVIEKLELSDDIQEFVA
jgi:hypothetical protein